jgi:hypothetical protein
MRRFLHGRTIDATGPGTLPGAFNHDIVEPSSIVDAHRDDDAGWPNDP